MLNYFRLFSSLSTIKTWRFFMKIVGILFFFHQRLCRCINNELTERWKFLNMLTRVNFFYCSLRLFVIHTSHFNFIYSFFTHLLLPHALLIRQNFFVIDNFFYVDWIFCFCRLNLNTNIWSSWLFLVSWSGSVAKWFNISVPNYCFTDPA